MYLLGRIRRCHQPPSRLWIWPEGNPCQALIMDAFRKFANAQHPYISSNIDGVTLQSDSKYRESELSCGDKAAKKGANIVKGLKHKGWKARGLACVFLRCLDIIYIREIGKCWSMKGNITTTSSRLARNLLAFAPMGRSILCLKTIWQCVFIGECAVPDKTTGDVKKTSNFVPFYIPIGRKT